MAKLQVNLSHEHTSNGNKSLGTESHGVMNLCQSETKQRTEAEFVRLPGEVVIAILNSLTTS